MNIVVLFLIIFYMATVSIDPVAAIRTLRYGLLRECKDSYERYVTNKDECTLEEFEALWNLSVRPDTTFSPSK